MGPGTGNWKPPAPNTLPNAAPPVSDQETCAECAKKCTNPKRGVVEYGCWCGADVAPVDQAGLQSQIPANESEWAAWCDKNNLPRPLDGVDACCRTHDLQLARLAQQKPGTTWNSFDWDVSAIHRRLSHCFAAQSFRGQDSLHGNYFAIQGKEVFDKLSTYTGGGAAVGDAWNSVSNFFGFGNAGSSSATSGAMGAAYP